MDNNLDNGTISKILEQLQDLNRNLSTGNLVGDKNRLFRPYGGSEEKFLNRTKELETILKNEKRYLKMSSKKESIEEHKAKIKDAKNELRDLKTQHAAPIVTAFNQILKGAANMIFLTYETHLKKQGIKLNAASEMQARVIQTYGKSLNNAIAIQVGNVTGTVLDTAYNSLNAVLEGGRTFYMKGLADIITQRRKENELYKENVSMIGGIAEEATGALASIPGPVGLIGSALNTMASLGKKAAMLEAAKTELRIKQSEEIMKLQDQFMQQIEGVVKSFSDMSKQVSKAFMEAGNAVFVYGRTLGISGDFIKRYQDSVINGINVSLAKFGMDYNDYFKMQASYNSTNGGRASIISTKEAELIAGLSKRVNISAEEVSSIAGGMNVFNIGVSNGTDMIYEMSKIANRMGLNATKFTKDMERNLKLAEKYQFKGGIKGVMEMALWAQKTRFNIEELSSLQEKMLSGNIEDVIQTSARLNVLGGNAALYSDPMAMLYNGLVNPQGLAESINNMVAGFGSFNRKTGETSFSTAEMLRLNQISQSTGVSRENLMNQVRQANKTQVIERRYGNKFDKKTLEGLTQHATFDKEKGDWIIKVNAPNTAEGFKEIGLNELNSNDSRLKEIFPEDKQDRLIDYVQDIRNVLSAGEEQAFADKYGISKTMGESYKKDLETTMRAMAREKLYATDINVSENASMVKEFAKAALTAQQQMNAFISEGNASSLVTSYLKFSSVKNQELLDATRDFVKSGVSIEDHLSNIETILSEQTGIKVEQKKVNDVIITPDGVVKTDPLDTIAAFKPGGSISRGFETNNNSSTNSFLNKIEVSGTLRLETGSQSIDLIELVKNDPQFFREMTERVLTEASKNKYGGRPMGTPTHYTI